MSRVQTILTIGAPATLLGMGVTLLGLLLLWAAIRLISWLARARPDGNSAA